MRGELGLVVALLAVAGLAWFSTAERMAGMDAGPGTALGSPGWFTGVWATMMAAMMLPSLSPAAAIFAATVRRDLSLVILLAAGYLLVWSAVGVLAYGLFELGNALLAGPLAWHSAGRWVTAGVLTLAALYQFTPAKSAFLRRCRTPEGRTDELWRKTRPEAFVVGLRNGGWCVGCTWALMAALFALGVMSLTWMGLIAALVAFEKIGPSGRGARLLTASVLLALAAAILLAPHDVPGFVVPGSPASPQMMRAMS
jgi:predicted metal-binding membrane protein